MKHAYFRCYILIKSKVKGIIDIYIHLYQDNIE